MYTHFDMFGNIGGFSLALQAAGFRTTGYMDNSPFATAIHARHYPSCCHFGNIFDYDTLPYADVFTAGFPCQPFSHAGKRLGRNDPRYLVPQMMKLLMEVHPRVILFENTPGFPSLNDGAEFRALLRTLAQNGYDAEWDHLRASDFGAPHIRERWFCVAYTHRQRRNGARAAGRRASAHHEERHDALCQQRRRDELFEITSGGQDVSDPASTGLPAGQLGGQPAYGTETGGGLVARTERCCAMADGNGERELQPQGSECPIGRRVGNSDQELADGHSARLAQYQSIGDDVQSEQSPPERDRGQSRRQGEQGPDESRLGRNLDGFSDWLDGLRWPAPQGAVQYDWEPPRTVRGVPFRKDRVERLGLAVVPPVVYPVALSIYEWLTLQDASQAREYQDAGAVAEAAR